MRASSDTASRDRAIFWLVLGGATLLRLAVAGRFGLSTDEAHYVLYARHLAWGYLDHPPAVGFLGAASMALGDGWLFMRLGPILCWAAACVLLRSLALALYGSERIALGALLVLLSIPLAHLLAVALLPDATLNLFWCGSLLAVWHATHPRHPRGQGWLGWCLAGVLLGGALLSKYHGVLLPLCIFLYLLSSPEQRHWLRRPAPWLGLALGALVFAPNVVWNYQNDWVSYAYQLGRGAGGSFKPQRLLENVGGQLGGMSPILLALLIAAWVALLRRRPLLDADRFVVATSLPVFLFFCSVGLSGRLLPHWTSVAWWTGSLVLVRGILLAVEAGGTRARRWRRWTIAGGVVAWLMILVIYVALATPVVGPLYTRAHALSVRLADRVESLEPLEPLGSHIDPTNDLYGWERVGPRVEAIRVAMPNPDRTFVFGHRFYTSSALGVYLQPNTVLATLYRKPSQYRLWFDAPAHAGWDALFVDDQRYLEGPERYRRFFASVDPEPIVIEEHRDGWPARLLHVYRYYGFTGETEANSR